MTKIFGRSIHQHGLMNNEIPLTRYFLFVGGALLALLFAAEGITPRQPTTESGHSEPRLPTIRIHSELKGPEAVVIDTSRPTLLPVRSDETTKTVAPPDPHVAEHVAQMVSGALMENDVKKLRKMEPKPQPRGKVSRARAKRPPVSYAQRPDVGPFDSSWTFDQQHAHIRESFAQLVPPQRRQGGARAWTGAEHARFRQFGWFDSGW